MSSVHCTEKCVTAGNDHPKYRTERSKLGNDNISVDYKYIAGIVCAEIHYWNVQIPINMIHTKVKLMCTFHIIWIKIVG